MCPPKELYDALYSADEISLRPVIDKPPRLAMARCTQFCSFLESFLQQELQLEGTLDQLSGRNLDGVIMPTRCTSTYQESNWQFSRLVSIEPVFDVRTRVCDLHSIQKPNMLRIQSTTSLQYLSIRKFRFCPGRQVLIRQWAIIYWLSTRTIISDFIPISCNCMGPRSHISFVQAFPNSHVLELSFR